MAMEMNDLAAFVAVARAAGFRDAARIGGVSPASLSTAVRRLEAKLSEAIERSPKCERAIFYRGNLRKKLSDMKGAIADFRRAFELNPRNLDAQREVRLFEMRAQKELEAQRTGGKVPEAPQSKPSFIGRLFKK